MLSKKKTAILALMITTSLTTGNLAFADSVKDKGTATNVKFNQDLNQQNGLPKINQMF